MRFKIFLHENDHLICLYRLRRSKNGLYIVNSHSRGDDYTSYHEDGNWWTRRHGDIKMLKKVKQPLSQFKNAETIVRSSFSIYKPNKDDRLESETKIKPEDIVFERKSPFFFMEIILSEKKLDLTEIPERLNTITFVKEQMYPIITIEIFDQRSNAIPKERYQDKIEYKEGYNLFFEDNGKM